VPDAGWVAINGRREAGLANAAWVLTSCNTGGWRVMGEIFPLMERRLIFRDMMALKFSDVDGPLRWRKRVGDALAVLFGQKYFVIGTVFAGDNNHAVVGRIHRIIIDLRPKHGGRFFMLVDYAIEKMIDQIGEKVGGGGDPQAFEAKPRDHPFLQGQQFGEHVIGIEAGARVGRSGGGRHEGEDVLHQIEGWMVEIGFFALAGNHAANQS
jgi:hypothetical protein